MITMFTFMGAAIWYAMYCFNQQECFKPEYRTDTSSVICFTIAVSTLISGLLYFAPPHAELVRVGVIAATMYGCILAKWLGARYYNNKEGIDDTNT